MYEWRRLTLRERRELLAVRQREALPWHSPTHRDMDGDWNYLVLAACYEHAHIIGSSPQRMLECEQELLACCRRYARVIHAWCLLPNHYHVLLEAESVRTLVAELGRFHGRSSHRWNGQDGQRGRHVWHNATDRAMRSDRHFWVSMNYVHHNPVKHGYVAKWHDWSFSSGAAWLEAVGQEHAKAIWQEYPVLDYGKEWDE
jgi:putative transposase